ncbi:AbrB family looped-hinge helix DNA binding protein [Sphingomonas sp. PP-F2F-A104-K0414]|uniref:AbrB/MazE/SpoVT family DNA-binding domain-containing protein n=1 Tax=Sphingomonas sp. PP-F2F-A104-K0414 TaxID=2135661 RepID=UPI0010522758|nr:AbrB/MazE/SpoVT family DNA-binding domain-containing protein [Sphingomonas sp. PP-F2F-A104-K0414]TCQ00066.1 AbrB family looped-hinge helix DNA binding protein [Sphingomonas sp. PP-F2F-A104-K0414]
MGNEVTISSKGQVVIPKDVRDALNLKAGTKLMLRQVGHHIVLEVPEPPRKTISYEEFRRRVPRYDGPTIAIEDMTMDIGTLFRDWKV